ncbi:MAG: hypothetical protein KCHDKBKB_00009 [Elusimicrobia bacterium]|nr:hypothetical protein [Elusimicrobiota bacterium]
MNKTSLPYKQVIFVCTNARPEGERISCAGAGRCGELILGRLREYVKQNKLQANVRVAKSGCQEKCEMGPNVMVMPQNEFLTQVTLDDVPEIIKDYLR